MTDMRPTTIWLPKPLLMEAKKKAAKRDMSLSAMVRQLIQEIPLLPEVK